MDIQQASALTSSAVTAAIPLMFAGAGELVTEKSGVLNLGVEGMMLMGAVTGYAVTAITGSPWLGVVAAIGAGLAMSLLFAFLTLTMLANQVATGLSLTIFGIGLSAYVGKPYTSAAVRATIDTWTIPGLSKIPVLGPALFSLTPLDYLAFLMFAVIWWFLYRTRAGLVLRSVGESACVTAPWPSAAAWRVSQAVITRSSTCTCGRSNSRRAAAGSRSHWWCSRRGARAVS